MGILLKDMAGIVLLRDEGARKIVHACMAPGFGGPRHGHQYQFRGREVDLSKLHVHGDPGRYVRKVLPILEAAERLWLKRRGAALRNGEDQSGLDQPGPAPAPRLDCDHRLPLRHQSKSNEIMEAVLAYPPTAWTTPRIGR